MTRTVALRLLGGALLLVALGHGAAVLPTFWPGEVPGAGPDGAGPDLLLRVGAGLLLVGTMGALVAVSFLGASRDGRAPRRLFLPLGLAFLLVSGGVGTALLLPPPGPDTPLWLGLPPGAALMVFGAGLLPLLVVPLAYAWSFPALGMAPREVDALLARARRASADPDPPTPDASPRTGDPGAGP